jgi:hypothetical protein
MNRARTSQTTTCQLKSSGSRFAPPERAGCSGGPAVSEVGWTLNHPCLVAGGDIRSVHRRCRLLRANMNEALGPLAPGIHPIIEAAGGKSCQLVNEWTYPVA